jgi:hypothetical protein
LIKEKVPTMQRRFDPTPWAWLCLVLAMAGSSRSQVETVAQSRDQAAAEGNDPSKGSKDVDQVVPYSMDKVLEASKLAMATYGCEIKNEKPDSLECTRSRHVGVFVGSGGEKVTVRLKPKGAETQVIVTTGKGFVGRVGKKNWSTPIFDEIVKNLRS